jgi:hypothetical protein
LEKAMLMTLEESIFYVFKALDSYWEEAHDDELGMFLSEFCPFYVPGYLPGTVTIATSDPAAWYDWVKAIQKLMPRNEIAEKALMSAKQAHQDSYDWFETGNKLFENNQITQEELVKKTEMISDGPFWDHWVETVRQMLPDGCVTEEQAKKALVLMMREYNSQGFQLNNVIEHIDDIFRNKP